MTDLLPAPTRLEAELTAQYEQSRAYTHNQSMRGRGLGFNGGAFGKPA